MNNRTLGVHRARSSFRRVIASSLILLIVCVVASSAAAQDVRDDLRQRFEVRYPALMKLKDQGRIGETWKGYVEAVLPEYGAETASLLDDENRDRKALYELLAKDIREDVKQDEREKVTADKVARRNARRNFDKAKSDEFLKVDDATWILKRDLKRYERLRELKRDRKVGETWEGYVAAVSDADDKTTRLIDEENEARLARYEQIARLRNTNVESIARAQAQAAFKHASPGDPLRTENGTWTRKES